MCEEGVRLFRALRDEFPTAMWTGDWNAFDEIRNHLEFHLLVVETEPEATSKVG